MEQNICKHRACQTEIPEGNTFCNYHKSKKKELKQKIITTTTGLLFTGVAAILLKKNKS